MMTQNRRRSERVPVGFYVEQFVDNDAYRCFTTDLSAIGLYMERLAGPLGRGSRTVQLEIQLPHTSESIWACGEVVYDRFDSLFHGSGVRFARMARCQQRLLREWLRDTQRAERFTALHPSRPSSVRIRRPPTAT